MSAVLKVASSASALAAVAAVLAGCGGGGGVKQAAPRPQGPGPSTIASGIVPSAMILPASANGPTTCTVYESGFATQVVFESPELDVRAECLAWTRDRPGVGYLWGYEPTTATTEAVGSRRVCYLIDPHANSTASVIQAAGFRSVSGMERQNASSACASLLASGWIAQLPPARIAHRVH
jgi:hypothetical protein